MRLDRIVAGTAVLLFVLSGCAALPLLSPPRDSESATATPPSAGTLQREVHDLVNRRRASQGLDPLTWNPMLAEIAAEHSRQMAAGARSFGHDGFDERAANAREALGITRFSENVAMNNYLSGEVARQVVEGWVGSAGHRRNLEGQYGLAGVGVARNGEGYYFVTQLYAAP